MFLVPVTLVALALSAIQEYYPQNPLNNLLGITVQVLRHSIH
jgi:hypothetical protein